MRSIAENIFLSAVDSVKPDKLIHSQVQLNGNTLHIAGMLYHINSYKNIYVLGAGKASALMAKALEEILKDKISGGYVVVKYGHGCNLQTLQLVEAGHPVPDMNGVKATKEMLKIVTQADEKDLVILLISGGASALLADYPEQSSLQELMIMNQLLLQSGADIVEINTVRKHLSTVKGGQLGRAAYPATVVSLILSDVIGDPIDVIASGPTSPDPSTYKDALDILEKYHLKEKFPVSMIQYLENGLMNRIPETPKSDEKIFRHIHNIIIGNNNTALNAAKDKALQSGFSTYILTSGLNGDIHDVAKYLLKTAKQYQQNSSIRKPVCLIAGGEPTIRITGKGLGGRNQHLALYCASQLQVNTDLTLLCAGTDGNDGPTNVAGAVIDENTIKKALSLNINPETYLADFDSFHFFQKTGGHIVTGATMTNVMDIIIILIT